MSTPCLSARLTEALARAGAATDRMRRLHAGGDLLVGHDGDIGGRRLRSEIAGDVELDGVDALAQAEPRHAAHLAGAVDRDTETLLMEMKPPAVAQAAGDSELGARGQQAGSV